MQEGSIPQFRSSTLRVGHRLATKLSGYARTQPTRKQWNRQRRTSIRSTGLTWASTESRPLRATDGSKRAASVGFSASGRTITSSIWRRMRMGIAGLDGVACPSKSRSHGWERRRSRRYAEGFRRTSDDKRRSDTRSRAALRENERRLRRWRLPEFEHRPRDRMIRGAEVRGRKPAASDP